MSKILAFVIALLTPAAEHPGDFPAGYYKYGKVCAKAQLKYFGQSWDPILLAQIEQESAWRATAQSPFAAGITQFTPSTQRWMEDVLGLGHKNIKLDVEHACMLQGGYMARLARWAGGLVSGFWNVWAATLRAYNGGQGLWLREWQACGQPNDWRAVEACRVRAGWAHKENTEYPHRIFQKRPKYAAVWQ